MLFLRFKIMILSFIAIVASSAFVLYKADLFKKEQDLKLLKTQITSTSQAAFDLAAISGEGANSHTYAIIDSIKKQVAIQDLWISRSDAFSSAIGKPNSTLRDQIERNVYITRSPSESMSRIDGTNDHQARISKPIIADSKCVVCHPGINSGEVIGAVNASILLTDNIMDIIYENSDFAIFLGGASLVMMILLMFSVKSISTIADSIKSSIQGAINGDFTQRVKSRMIGTDDLARLINKLLDTLDKNIAAIDTKIATIFIYNRQLYSKNPISRLSEVINEIVALYSFKNKIDAYKKTNDIYREIQVIIQKYIKYKSLIFAELLEGEIVSGYKVENNASMKVMAGEINSIEKRLENINRNVLYSDEKGSVFISTSIGGLNVIDLQFIISNKLTIYYSIALESKKELNEKEKSITRIYNYMREARHIINNKMLMREIEESSYTDPLTKAFNRFFLDKHGASLKEKLDRHINFGVLMLDIDHFKKINDTYGHAVGDAGIVLLVETIRKVIRPIDKLIRYGGEEFVVIIDSADLEEAKRVGEKIRTAFAMAKKCSRGELNFQKSVSIGVSSMPEFSRDIWACINQADLALYEAKEGGRNRVIPYSNEVQARADAKNAEKEKAEKAKAEAQHGIADSLDTTSADSDDDFEESLRRNNQV